MKRWRLRTGRVTWLRWGFLTALFGVSGFAVTAEAQSGSVGGRVRDATRGGYLEGVRVSLEGTEYSATTDRIGAFTISGISEGSYVLLVVYLGLPSATERVVVRAGERTSVIVTLGEEIDELETFVVEGTAVGQARAINRQRNAEVLKTIVASDAIGRFPDQNAAESLQRLLGLSIQKDQGEGRFVSIRGIDPDLSNYQIDGVNIGAPEGETRAVALDVIPSEILDSIEATKVLTPDMDGDSVGGTINIKTKSAFDREPGFFRGSVVGAYNGLVDRMSGKVTSTYSTVFGDHQQFGFLVSGTYQERQLGSSNSEVDGAWKEVEDSSGRTMLIAPEIEFRNYEISRNRSAVSSAFEYKPSEDGYFYVRGLYKLL